MKEHPWFKLWAKDWLGDAELRLCSPEAKGLLADVMAVCHDGKPYGYMNRKDGTTYTPAEFCDLYRWDRKVFDKCWKELISRDRVVLNGKGPFVPRLVKEREKLVKYSKHGKKGGNPDLKGQPISYSKEFESFWTVYPRPVGKRRAYGSWMAARSLKISAAKMVKAAKQYADTVVGVDVSYIKSPYNWIDEGCYDDVHAPKKKSAAAQRKAKEKEQYETVITEAVDFIKENGSDSMKNIEKDIAKQLGKKAVADFRKRLKKGE